MIKKLKFIVILLFFIFVCEGKANSENNLKEAILNNNRKVENTLRDKFRNPLKTLSFFGITSNMKVLEIAPGSGWYSEILSKYLKNSNGYYVAKYKFPPVKILEKIQENFDNYFKKNEKKFGRIQTIFFSKENILESNIKDFDLILTFRNTHNWLRSNTAENVYKSAFILLKKGGTLGVVQHRANEEQKENFQNGYVKESFLIDFIEKQGFKFVGKSEINANPKDSKDYKQGVWTLPPRLILGEKNKDKYLQIGESDRMTLKFVKP